MNEQLRQAQDAMAAAYSRAERLADAVIHVSGVVAALIAAPVLVTLAAVWHGDAATIAAAAVYGVSMIAMFGCSALYHLIPATNWRWLLRRLDHAAIYVKIAGTYTPFAVLLAGRDAVWILGGIWTAAALGVVLKLLAPHRFERASLVLYLAMGWAIVGVGGPILDALTPAALTLMISGGVLYTGGVVFFLWERLRFHNAIWHLMVLAASFVFYAGVLVEVAQTAPV